MTVCNKCHTSANHKEGGKLWGITPKVKSMAGAAFMNQVRWKLYEEFKNICQPEDVNIHLTYGSVTKRERHSRRISKTHANDAYCIGKFRPKHKSHEEHYRKRRRNERVLAKFYDAKVVDTRTGDVVKGATLGCERTNRRESRTEKTLRKYRGRKISKGYISLKEKRAVIPTGSMIRYEKRLYKSTGMHCNGTRVTVKENGKQKSLPLKKVTVQTYANAYLSV